MHTSTAVREFFGSGTYGEFEHEVLCMSSIPGVHLLGNENPDSLAGSVGNDTLTGGGEVDTLQGFDCDDRISGNSGGDRGFGNRGRDTLYGGVGDDTLHGGRQNDTLYGEGGDDWLLGDRDRDLVLGDSGRDWMFGGSGMDSLFGNTDSDSLYGGKGNDCLFGGQGDDRLFGDLDDDTLSGDRGADTMTGGDGSDVFAIGFNTGGTTLADADIITDFTPGEDAILLLGNLTFDALNLVAGTGENAGDTIVQNRLTGEFLAVLQGVDTSSLSRDDFQLSIDAPNTTIRSISPQDDEDLVNPNRELIVRFSRKVDPTTITPNSVRITVGGEPVPGRLEVSSTEEFFTFFPDSPWPEGSEIRVEIEGNRILTRDGVPLDGDGNGVPGGNAITEFETLVLTPVADTSVSGFLFDSANRNENGSERAIVGATLQVEGRPDITAVTDENGFFTLENVPSPRFFVTVDGSTATNAPDGTVYPTLGEPFESVPGEDTALPFNIYLPPMDLADVQSLSETEATNIGFGDAGKAQLGELFPEVDPAVWDATYVTFPTRSARNDRGEIATQAAIVPVNPDRLPGPLPPGLDPQLVISIQAGIESTGDTNFNAAGGATNFDIPAPVQFPNLEGLPPGTKTAIWSFDHDAGRWRDVGSATVSDDGQVVTSDPGVGILAPGWHFISRGGTGFQPIANDDVATTDIDTVVEIAVLENDFDSDGDPLTVTLGDVSPENGTVTTDGTTITYTPNTGFRGVDRLTYNADDGNGIDTGVGFVSTATVTVSVIDPNLETVSITPRWLNLNESGSLFDNDGDVVLSRTGTTGDLTVNFFLDGVDFFDEATRDADYTLTDGDGNPISGNSITIPDGSDRVTLRVVPIDDELFESTEAFSIELTNGNYNIGTFGNTTEVWINDDEPSVFLWSNDFLASESGFNTGEFAIGRTNVSTIDVTVNFEMSGVAVRGVDYVLTDRNLNVIEGNTITIPAGELYAYVQVNPIADGVLEPDETLQLTLLGGDDYALDAFSTQGSVTILNNDSPASVRIEAIDPFVSEIGGDAGVFRLSRSDNFGDLTVQFAVVDPATGTSATLGEDYILTDAAGNAIDTNNITIADGSFDTVLRVQPLLDDVGEGSEIVQINLVADPSYAISPTSNFAQMQILDKVPVSVFVSDFGAGEANVFDIGNGEFTVSRPGTTGALTIDFTIDTTVDAGSFTSPATFGEDYILTDSNGTPLVGNSITIPEGTSSAAIVVQPLDDNLAEGRETVQLNFPNGEDYEVTFLGVDRLVFLSDDEPEVSIQDSDRFASEAGPDPGEFTIYRSIGNLDEPLTVNFEIVDTPFGPPPTLGTDYTLSDANGETLPNNSITIPAGENSATIRVNPLTDEVREGAEVVRLRIADDPGYFVRPFSRDADVILLDANAVSIEATDSFISENNGDATGEFTLTRQNLDGEIAVNFEVTMDTLPATLGEDYIFTDENGVPLDGNSITIADNVETATILVEPIDDDIAEGLESVEVNLLGGPDYTVGIGKDNIYLRDDEPEYYIFPRDGNADETGLNPGEFAIGRFNGEAGDVTVNFDILTDVGTSLAAATEGIDYTLSDINGNPLLGNSITIADGEVEAIVRVNPIDDSPLDDPNEVVRLQLVADPEMRYYVNPLTTTRDIVIL